MPSSTAVIAGLAAIAILAAAVPAHAGIAAPGDMSKSSSFGVDRQAEATLSGTGERVNVTVRSGPRVDWNSLDTSRAVRTAITSGTLPRTDEVTVNDPLVLAVHHEGLSKSLARGDSTRRFFDHVAGNDTTLSIVQTNPTPERRAKRVRITENTTSVSADPSNGTTYVVVDTRRAEVYFGDPSDGDADDRTRLRSDDRFVANLTIESDSNLTTADRPVGAEEGFTVRVRQANIEVDDELVDRVYVNPTSNQRIGGVTNVRTGLNVSVVVRWNGPHDETGDESRVVRRAVAVQADESNEDGSMGRFDASFDFTDVPQNSTASVDVRFDGRSLLHQNATLVVSALEAEVGVREIRPEVVGPYDIVETDVELSRGGFVVLHRGNATGEIVGVSRYLPRGSYRNVSVYVGYPVSEPGRLVAVAHRDANYNHWFDDPSTDKPYRTNGTASARTEYVLTPQEMAQAATTTPTIRPPKSTTQQQWTSPSDHSSTPRDVTRSGTESTSQPGFGVFEGVLAFTALLVGLALWRGRRSN